MSTRTDGAAGDARPDVWAHCMQWADLLIHVHLRMRAEEQHDRRCLRGQRLSPEAEATLRGADRPLTVVLLAAGLHHQAQHQDVSGSPEDAAGLWVHTPGTGVTHRLRYAPYAALRAAPEADVDGAAERARLLSSAVSTGPDDRLMWERIRPAAVDVVDGVTRGRPYVALADVLAGERRRLAWDRLGELYGDE